MATAIENLTAQVQRNTDVAASAVQMIQGLAAQIVALKNDPVALQKVAYSMKASDDDLAAAILASTPSDPNAGNPPTA